MRVPHLIVAAALFALAIILFLQGSALTYYTSIGPGAGFFPRWISGLLALVSAGIFVQALLDRNGTATAIELPDRAGTLRALAVLVALGVAAALLRPLGFRLTMLLVLLPLLFVFGYRQPVGATVLALLGSFGSYQLFHGLLGAPLPVGALGI